MSNATKNSVFSRFSQNKSSAKRSVAGGKSGSASGIRVRKSIGAEKHKKRIMDVVNQLNEEELEKVSEMLRVSEALDNGDDNMQSNNEEGDDRMDRMDDFADEGDGDTVIEAEDHVSEMMDIALPVKRVTVMLPED